MSTIFQFFLFFRKFLSPRVSQLSFFERSVYKVLTFWCYAFCTNSFMVQFILFVDEHATRSTNAMFQYIVSLEYNSCLYSIKLNFHCFWEGRLGWIYLLSFLFSVFFKFYFFCCLNGRPHWFPWWNFSHVCYVLIKWKFLIFSTFAKMCGLLIKQQWLHVIQCSSTWFSKQRTAKGLSCNLFRWVFEKKIKEILFHHFIFSISEDFKQTVFPSVIWKPY